jgi:hypothetical protein
MKKISFIFFLNFIIICSSLAQEVPQPNGYFWIWTHNSLLRTNQVSYLTGFLDGINSGEVISLLNFKTNSICRKTGIESFEQNSRVLDSISLMNIQDQMNIFYRDTNNLHITCPHAFWISVLKLSKADTKQIDDLIELYRKEDKDIMNILEEKVESEKKEEKSSNEK